MSVFICDKTRFKFQLVFSQLIKSYFGKLFRQCRDISETFLKPFKKLVVRDLSHLKHSATHRVLYVIKHSYSFIKHYLKQHAFESYFSIWIISHSSQDRNQPKVNYEDRTKSIFKPKI